MANAKDCYDKFKIWAETIGIGISLVAVFCGGYTYFHGLKVDKSQVLYNDFVINGIIPLELKVSKIARAHFSPQSPKGRYQIITSRLPPKTKLKGLKERWAATTLHIDPLTHDEKEQVKKASEEAVDLLNSKLFFLGREITLALNCSINLLRDERASRPSPFAYFLSPRQLKEEQGELVQFPDAYRYKILVNTNYRFLRDSLKAVADYILKKNIHTYKEMTQLSELTNKEDCCEEVVVVLKNLKEFKKIYLAYVNWWRGMPTEECLEKNTELLVSFFEEYIEKEGHKEPVEPIKEEDLCGKE